jgi:hypothetical protein
MALVPTGRALVCSDAAPPPSVPLPRSVGPSEKLTEPVAVGGLTVAVNVTISPSNEGFGDEPSAVAVTVKEPTPQKPPITTKVPPASGPDASGCPIVPVSAYVPPELPPPPPSTVCHGTAYV